MQLSHSLTVACALVVMLSATLHAADGAGRAAREAARPAIMGYGVTLSESEAERLKEGGWTLILSREADLDLLRQHGLRSLLRSDLLKPETLDDPAKRAELDEFIARVKDHPVLSMYWIVDEPNASRFEALGRLLSYLRERDPAHPGYINLFPTYASNEQLGTQGDVVTAYQEHVRRFIDEVQPEYLSYDHYHFAAGGLDRDQYFLNLALIRRAALDAGLPFLNFIQACTWTPSMREPNSNELRFLTYTSLAYGASALAHYTYSDRGPHTGCPVTAEGEATALWHGMKRSNHEFLAIREQLQPLTSLAAYHVGMIPPGANELPTDSAFTLDPSVARMDYTPPEPLQGMLLGYFGRSSEPTHVVVVNLDYRRSTTTTLVGPGRLEVFNASRRAWLPASDGSRALLRLQPGGGVLVRLR